jgi:hypothetical protein
MPRSHQVAARESVVTTPMNSKTGHSRIRTA